MDQLWNYFDAIYCINIRDRKDWYLLSKKEFDKLAVPVQYHFVTKHKNGDIGCFQSHTELCRQAYNLLYQRIIIFEDDVEITQNFTPQTVV